MKTIILTSVLSLTLAAPLLADNANLLTNETTRLSYAMGVIAGYTWKARGVTNVDYEIAFRGIKDVMSDRQMLMSEDDIRKVLTDYERVIAKQQDEERLKLAAKNEKISAAFLVENKTRKGIVTLPDGLQYRVITEGEGPLAAPEDTVTADYEGGLTDGTKFVSQQNAALHVGGLMPGLREALTHMNAGSEWEVFIPPSLAYGAVGRMPRIEPNTVLVFKVHLLALNRPKPITSDIIKVPSAEDMKKGAKVEVIKPDEAQKMEGQSTAK